MTDRPLIPEDLLPLAIAETSGCSIDVARAEALPLLEYLSDNGARISYDLALPKSAPAGDPTTAAAEISDLNDRQWAVWWLLDYHGPQTDEKLTEHYQRLTEGGAVPFRGHILPPQTPQSIRSRRAELVRAGHVQATGERRPTSNGGTAAVWRASGTEVSRLAEAS